MNSKQRIIAAISCVLALWTGPGVVEAQDAVPHAVQDPAQRALAHAEKTTLLAPIDYPQESDVASNLELYMNQPASLPGDSGTSPDASWLYANSHPSDSVEFYGSTDRFDLGKMNRSSRSDSSGLLVSLWHDQLNLYSPESLLLAGVALGTGAAIANTQLDGDIQRHLQSSLHRANSDEWLEGLHANKELGDGRYTLPIFAGAWALGSVLPPSQFSDGSRVWGQRTLRGFLVGAPPVLLLQRVTGSSRPGESTSGSEWVPFHDNNGVSGHAFMGSLPFITAAKMSDSLVWKTTFFAASALAPLSRTADGAHYPSQVALGWSMAFLAATAVHSTDNPHAHWHILPTATPNGSGMALEYRF